MAKLRVGIIGMGFIGGSHIDAVRRVGIAELAAVTDVNYELAKKKAADFNVPKCYAGVDELLADKDIDAVHNCTPNNLHLEINEKIIKAGKHVLSEKPLATTSKESAHMLKLLEKYPNTVNGVNFNYRMNPLVQDMKNRIHAGQIGRPILVHGSYLQDWLLYDTDYNWRLEPDTAGPSRCVADIGSHWMDAVQTVTGGRITEVCADVLTYHKTRKKPKGQVETFSVNTNAEYEERPITTEDYAAVLFRMDNGAHGVFHVSEVSAGRKCFLNFEIDGTKSSVYWNQETPDQMWMGFRDSDNALVMRNPNLMTKDAAGYTYLAAGHPEGWNDAQRNNIQAFYKFIAEGKKPGVDKCDFATFADAHYIMLVTEAILESGKSGKWVKVK